MKLYRVTLQKAVAYEASVEIAARDDLSARDEAERRADAGMVAWTQVHEEKCAVAEEAEAVS